MNNPYLQKFKEQQLRACQLKQLSILEEIDRICQKHQIGYWLDGGTLFVMVVLFLGMMISISPCVRRIWIDLSA